MLYGYLLIINNFSFLFTKITHFPFSNIIAYISDMGLCSTQAYLLIRVYSKDKVCEHRSLPNQRLQSYRLVFIKNTIFIISGLVNGTIKDQSSLQY